MIRMTDSYTDELFDCDPALACRVVFPVSRLVVDPERFVDDTEEPMAKEGMGVVSVKTSYGAELRAHPSTEERQSLIAAHWEPHHEKLSIAVGKALAANSKCLIIDCHSFPSLPRPYEPDQSPDRPGICIGTDAYHTPPWLRDLAYECFHSRGFRVEFDRPYSGTMVPSPYRQTRSAVLSVMIEVNRSLYMDETSGRRNIQFAPFKSKLTAILEALISRARVASIHG